MRVFAVPRSDKPPTHSHAAISPITGILRIGANVKMRTSVPIQAETIRRVFVVMVGIPLFRAARIFFLHAVPC
jgi:hypothetical protein